jgi:hypothetical protein
MANMNCARIIILGFPLLAVFPAFGQNINQGEFLKAYREHSEGLEAFYENSHIEAKTVTRQERLEGDKVVGKVELAGHWDFVANRPRYRWVGESQANPGAEMETMAFVASPDQLFRLRRSESSSEYSVISITNSPPPQVYNNALISIKSRATAACAPFSVFDTRIVDFFSEKTTSMTRINRNKTAQDSVIHVDWIATEPKRRGYVEFFESNYAMKEYEFQFLEEKDTKGKIIDFKYRCQITYDEVDVPVPKVKQVYRWIDFEGRKSEEFITDVSVIEQARGNTSQFTLEDFGIYTERPPNRTPFVITLLITATACGFGAWAIRWYLRQGQNRMKSAEVA